jgi:hypothetical protein
VAMKVVGLFATALLGLFWLLVGLNGFAHFFAFPQPATDAGQDALRALVAARWPLPTAYGVEIAAGAALLARRFLPLGVLLLAPLTAAYVLYALFQSPSDLPLALVLAASWAVVAWENRAALAPVVRP